MYYRYKGNNKVMRRRNLELLLEGIQESRLLFSNKTKVNFKKASAVIKGNTLP